MFTSRFVEYAFFFGLLGIVGYLVWQLLMPFVAALSFAAIIVTICYPLYERVRGVMPRKNRTLAAFLTTFIVILVVIIPLSILGMFVFREAASIYTLFNNGGSFSLVTVLTDIELVIKQFLPEFSLDITAFVQGSASFITSNLRVIFTGTASTVFMFFIGLVTTFYLFRDGKGFTKYLIEVSPLPDSDDTIILKQLARSVRSVALGIVLVALIQGILTAIGLALFGFERAILWGAVAAFGALIPGIGTSIVFIPAVAYLIITGDYLFAAGVAVWATFAVGLIDNLLGPYLMSRGVTLHPLMILLSVLGGIALFGVVGFMLGPIVLSLFKVLLELYKTHIAAQPGEEKTT